MSSSDDDDDINFIEESIIDTSLSDDLSMFTSNYEEMKKEYKTRPYLSKYEKTAVISERSQQLANGAESFLANPKSYNTVYEIALEELRQKKIPFIIQRPSSNKSEYWKLQDLKIL
jgi:DNA-directed RNA polymerase subunit K/omega|tara:strand:+ start:1025 stop:1372 length:348 start_codon:yes stop_codon:yes gene_type:complete